MAAPVASASSKKLTDSLFGKLNLEIILVLVLLAASLIMILAAAMLSGQAPQTYVPAKQIPVDTVPPTIEPNGVDTDADTILDIDENYIYGTDVTKVDTDHDGMPDPWEVQYKDARNAETRELLIDPVDPTDAYEDPDGDGYDFNNNGKIDVYQDSIVRSNLSIPVKAQYEANSVCGIAQNQLQFDGRLIHFDRVAVMDNGSYGEPNTNPSTLLTVRVTDTTTTGGGTSYVPSDCTPMRVELGSGSNRPATVASWKKGATGAWLEGGDLINIEGLFHVDPSDLTNWWIEIRGGEQFPNIQEYQTWRDYEANGRINGSNPLVRDTDLDGMWDGFEAHYGKGHLQVTNTTQLWIWEFFLSPVNTTDADLDPDNDGIRITWNELVRACLLRDVNGTCIREVPPDKSPGDFVLAGTNLHEFYLQTRPDAPDTDNDTYPAPGTQTSCDQDAKPPTEISEWNTADMQEVLVLGTNPIKSDSDGDGMDDGWEVFYTLLPENASDKFEDPDGDLLPNINEYANPGGRLDPRTNDTDSDLLPDGWEVTYQLDACRNDANEDVDLTRGVVTPDGLTNLQEYAAGTNPRKVDTDDDFLSDFDEVTRTFQVSVEGKVYHYRTAATEPDTDLDDESDDEDADGNFAPCEEILDGLDNDGDARYMQNDNSDNDGDGVIDDGPFGKAPTAGPAGVDPSAWLPEGVDEEHDLCDWNEVTIFHTNASNADSDLEGLSDWVELFTDRNTTKQGDQTTNPNLRDSDGDKLDDSAEVPHLVGGVEQCLNLTLPGYAGGEVDVCTDPLNPDSDGDGLEDGLEVTTKWASGTFETSGAPIFYSTNPRDVDTDRDGLNDGFEFDNSDIDGDGLPTRWEIDFLGVYPLAYSEADADGSLVEDAYEDWDADGLSNLEEYQRRTDPFDRHTVDDNVLDSDLPVSKFAILRLPVYSDTDGDQMPDWWEKLHGFDARVRNLGCTADSDTDGFKDLDEYLYNTEPRGSTDPSLPDKFNHVFVANPSSCDSDLDGIADWWEEMYGLIPGDPTDADRNLDKELNASGAVNIYNFPVIADNWTNFEEYVYARDPYNHISTDPTTGDTDLDAYNFRIKADGTLNLSSQPLKTDFNKFFTDDKDSDPVVLWHPKRPVNPGINATSLSPVKAGDAPGDIDRDGLNNTVEAVKRTSAFDADSDGDGMPDGWEVQYGIGNTTTGKPILDPLYPGDAEDDPDNDGWNYSRVTDPATSDGQFPNGHPIITRQNFNGDSELDNFLDNEQFSNIEEYYFGDDTNGDGINDVTTHPGKLITNADKFGNGPVDGFVQYFRDRDFDQLPRWYETMFNFNDGDREGGFGGIDDADNDGVSNVIEARSKPWTNPRDVLSVPPQCSWPREFLPDPENPPGDWPC